MGGTAASDERRRSDWMLLTRYLVDVNCRETKEAWAIRLKRLGRRMSRQPSERLLFLANRGRENCSPESMKSMPTHPRFNTEPRVGSIRP